MERSARGDPPPLLTRVVAVAVLVKFWADFVPVTEAVLFKVVPLAAVTMPRIVTTHTPPPSTVPAEQVTRLAFCAQLPRELVRTSWGGTPMPPTPFTWSESTRLLAFAPPVLTTVIVYVSWEPEATGSGLSALVIAKGLAGSAGAIGTPTNPRARMAVRPAASAAPPMPDSPRRRVDLVPLASIGLPLLHSSESSRRGGARSTQAREHEARDLRQVSWTRRDSEGRMMIRPAGPVN